MIIHLCLKDNQVTIIWPVWPVIDHLSQKFSYVYDPHCEVAVDEAMFIFQCRTPLKVHPNEANKKRQKCVCVYLEMAMMAIFKLSRSTREKKVLDRLTLE